MELNQLTDAIIGAAIEVHRHLGPGLLESAYRRCLCHELTLRGVSYATELQLPIEYKGMRLESGYRIDLLVARAVVVEVKAVDKLSPIFEAQTLTYLRLGHHQVGLIINFNVALLKNGLKRLVLDYDG